MFPAGGCRLSRGWSSGIILGWGGEGSGFVGSGGGRGGGPEEGKDSEGVVERLWGRTRSSWKLLALEMWLWWRNSCLAGKEGSWAVDPDPCPCLVC